MKRSHYDVDPDYEDLSEQQNKRQRFLEEDGTILLMFILCRLKNQDSIYKYQS